MAQFAAVTPARGQYSMFGISRPLVIGACLIGSGALAVAAPCTAQSSHSDSVGTARTDSASAAEPSTAGRSRPDSAGVTRPDSAAASKPDSAARPKPDSVPPPDSLKQAPGAAATAPGPPADSTLTAACSGTPDASPAIAPGLLLVVFDPATKPAERSAIAHTVHGKLVGPAKGEGAYYLRVPGAESDDQLRAIADEVIRLPGVQQVGTKTCHQATQQPGTAPPRPPS